MGDVRIELEREDDGRWIAEVPSVPGVMAYGADANDALQKVSVLLREVIEGLVADGDIGRDEADHALAGIAA